MPLCFAYGSNMDRDAMAGRCPASRLVGTARLERHRLAIMREGYATAVRDPRRAVHGLLWDVPQSDIRALDRYEGVGGGLYVKRLQPVLGEGGMRHALVYLGSNAGPGVPRPGYLETVLAAAEAAGLPAAYRAEIAALAARGARVDAAASSFVPARSVPAVRPTRSTPFDPPRQQSPDGWRWRP